MKTLVLRFGSAASAAVLALAALAAAPAPMHVRLTKSEPMADSTVVAAPTEIKLWFSAPVQVPVTTVRVSAVDGTSQATIPVRASSGSNAPLVAALPRPLTNGRYSVAWRTMSRDGHVISGTFAFTVAAPAPTGN